MTRDQLGACIALQNDGFHGVLLIQTDNTPIPGLSLFIDEGHTKLLMVQPDGSIVDLLAVHALALDCVRNWQDYPDRKLKIDHFVGDFGRLTKLAQALNGSKLPRMPEVPPPGASS